MILTNFSFCFNATHYSERYKTMALRDDWKSAKTAFEKKRTNSKFSSKDLKTFSKGANFGPSLKKFEQSKTLADKKTNIILVIKAVDKYEKMIKKMEASSKESNDTLALGKLKKELFRIKKVCQDATQNPEPSGRSDKVMLVSQRNVASNSKPKWLKVNPINVSAYLVVDKTVMELEKSGELGHHWINLQNNCNAIVEKSTAAFVSTIAEIDNKIMGLSESKREAKLKEANEVLLHYKKIVDISINKEVDDYWAKLLARHGHLKAFKKQCVRDIVVGTVSIASSATSIALTFGIAAVGALAIAKSTADIAVGIHKLGRNIESLEKQLQPNMIKILELLEDRKKKGQGLNKVKEAGKEVAAFALGQASELVITTTSRTEKQCREYSGKLTVMEAEAQKMYKEIQEFTSKFPSSPKGLDKRQNDDMLKAHKTFVEIKREFEHFRHLLNYKIQYAEWAQQTCANARKKDNYVATEKKLLDWGGVLLGLATLTNFTVKVISKVT
jgi:hypothetical protein